VKEGFYDGIVFHRVIDGFMAQTGLPAGHRHRRLRQEAQGRISTPEPHVARHDVDGRALASPDSGDSQFFICFDDAPFLNKQYTVWGQGPPTAWTNVDKIKRGEPVKNPDKIVKAHMADDAG